MYRIKGEVQPQEKQSYNDGGTGLGGQLCEPGDILFPPEKLTITRILHGKLYFHHYLSLYSLLRSLFYRGFQNLHAP